MKEWLDIPASAILAGVIFMILTCLVPLFLRIGMDYLIVGASAVLALNLLLVYVAKQVRSKPMVFSWADAVLLVFWGYIFLNGHAQSSISSPILFWKWISACLAFLLGKTISDNSTLLLAIFMGTAVVQAVIVLLQCFGVLVSLSFFFPVSGTFGNPQYPATLICVGLIILAEEQIARFRGYGPFGKIIILTLAITLLSALFVCGTRSCLFALIVVIGVFIYWRKPSKNVALILFMLIVASIISLYYLRPGSANVRLLIWRAGIPMFLAHPFLGKGVTSFMTDYMYAQADYFAIHPNSPFTLFASDHCQPYNELLRLLCEEGLVGTLLFCLFLGLIFSRRNASTMPLLAICIIGLTFNVSDHFVLYLMFWILAGIKSSSLSSWSTYRSFAYPVASISCILIVFVSILRLSSPSFMKDPSHEPEVPTYWHICEKGDNKLKEGDSSGAEEMYRLAWRMVPCRITAPFRLYNLYLEEDSDKAEEMADYILNQQELQYVNGQALEMRNFVRQHSNN